MEKEFRNAMVLFDDGRCGFADLTDVRKEGERVTVSFSSPIGFKSSKDKRIEAILIEYDIYRGTRGLNEK